MEKNFRSLFKTMHNHQQQETLGHPIIGKANEFYFACRNGDIDTVKQMLTTIPYDQLNQLEPNGSTPLHAATYFGHSDIVRLLLHEYGCQRHQRNRYGLTAYEEALTDDMRQLYHRPSNKHRFNDQSNNSNRTFQLMSSSNPQAESDTIDDDDKNVSKPDQRYMIGYETNEEIKKQLDGLNGVKAFFQSRIGRYIMEQGMKWKVAKEAGYGEEEYAYVTSRKFRQQSLQRVLDGHVTPNHPEYLHCSHLLKEYIQHGTIESLLKLYTLETPFYHQLLILSSPLGFPFFMHLKDLKHRYYQGFSYRGVQLTWHEFNEYRWAWKNEETVLSLLAFASTSIDRHVAEQFSSKSSPSSNKCRALLIFHFSQPCDTAINLGAITEYHLPCISNYENEREVLVGPRSVFKVTKIEFDPTNEQYTIYLENLCGEHLTLIRAIKVFIKNDLKEKANKVRNH